MRCASLEPARNETVHGCCCIEELLVGSKPVACLHFRNEPAVVPNLIQRGAYCRPIVVAQENIGIHALIAAPAPVPHDIL